MLAAVTALTVPALAAVTVAAFAAVTFVARCAEVQPHIAFTFDRQDAVVELMDVYPDVANCRARLSISGF